MKKLFSMLLFLGGASWAQFPSLSNYLQFQYFGFETRLEANGVVVVAGNRGDTTLHTSISLDGNQRHNGDSSVVCFITKRNGSTDCNDMADSCQRHRCYTVQRFRGHKVEPIADTSKYTGVLLKAPFFVDFWYRYSNEPLVGTQWSAPFTWCNDTSDNCINPITVVRTTHNYLAFDHVPTFDSSTTTYQADSINDPYGFKKVLPNKWYHLQSFMDNDSANGYAILWVDGKLESTAKVHGRNGTLAQFHGPMYASTSIPTGTEWMDELTIGHVDDTNDFIRKYMDRNKPTR